MTAPAALGELAELLGPKGYFDDPAALAPCLSDPINGANGAAQALLRPATADEAARAVRLCATAGLPITPRGGGTGFVGGALPAGGVLMDLGRMRAIRTLDAAGGTATVEAGLTLAALEDALAPHGLTLPIRHGGAGSATLGGTVATNAGGANVLAHGMTRAYVLGLEVVLACGTLWSGLRPLVKDNTGYDLKQLFIGAEGTLGLVTAVTLRLVPHPGATATALLAADSPAAALAAFTVLRRAAGPLLAAAELMAAEALAAPAPLSAPWLLLLQIEAPAAIDADALLAHALTPLPEGCPDALLAASSRQRADFWALREGLAAAMAEDPRVLKSDTAVPVAAIPAFIEEARAAVAACLPGARCLPFGHIGDGNIHFNVGAPAAMSAADFAPHRAGLADAIRAVSLCLGGTLSAEHGIGATKRAALAAARPADVALMQRLKAALDPDGIMNPGKVL